MCLIDLTFDVAHKKGQDFIFVSLLNYICDVSLV